MPRPSRLSRRDDQLREPDGALPMVSGNCRLCQIPSGRRLWTAPHPDERARLLPLGSCGAGRQGTEPRGSEWIFPSRLGPTSAINPKEVEIELRAQIERRSGDGRSSDASRFAPVPADHERQRTVRRDAARGARLQVADLRYARLVRGSSIPRRRVSVREILCWTIQ